MFYSTTQLSALLADILATTGTPLSAAELLTKAKQHGFKPRNNNQGLGRILRTLTTYRHLFTKHPNGNWTLKTNRHHQLHAQLIRILITYMTSNPQPHTAEHLHSITQPHLPPVTLEDIEQTLLEPTFHTTTGNPRTYMLNTTTRTTPLRTKKPYRRTTTSRQKNNHPTVDTPTEPEPTTTTTTVNQEGGAPTAPEQTHLPPATFSEVADTLERAQQALTITQIRDLRNVDPTDILHNHPNSFTRYPNNTWGLNEWTGTVLPLIDNPHPLAYHLHAIMRRRTKGISPAKLADQLNQHPNAIKEALNSNPRIFTSTRRARIGTDGNPNGIKRHYALTLEAQNAKPRALLPGMNSTKQPKDEPREQETPEERMRRQLFG